MNDMIRLRGRATSARAWMIAIGSSDGHALDVGLGTRGARQGGAARRAGFPALGGQLAPSTRGSAGVGSVICCTLLARIAAGAPQLVLPRHSHSIVAGGLLLMSYTTRFTPGTSFTMRLLILPRTSYGSFAQSAVMPSSEVTARIATTLA